MLESKFKTCYVTYLHILPVITSKKIQVINTIGYEHSNIVGYEPFNTVGYESLVSNTISNIRGHQADVY